MFYNKFNTLEGKRIVTNAMKDLTIIDEGNKFVIYGKQYFPVTETVL